MENKKQERFLALYEPVHANFERFCRARVYGTGDYKDLMNETLLKAYQKLDTLRSETAFLSFLFSIAVRILANENRKRSTERLPGDEDAHQIADHQANTASSTEVYFLHQALAKLPEEQRESLLLFELSGFTIKEIAEIQSASETAVKQRLRRGRMRLKELLTPVMVEEKNKL